MNSIKLFLLLPIIIIFCSLKSDNEESVQWLTFDQAIQKCQKEKRKIVIDVYTDWCGWCKRMEKSTFHDPNISKLLNESYYPVRFNAEQKGSITFKGKEYKFVSTPKGGYHELAAELLKGQLGYPTIVFLDESQNVIQAIPGYKDAEQFEKIATYFAENHYKKIPWTKYEREYKPRSYNQPPLPQKMNNSIPVNNNQQNVKSVKLIKNNR